MGNTIADAVTPPFTNVGVLNEQEDRLAAATNAPLAIICALEEELCHLRASLPEPEIIWHAGRQYELTQLDQQPLVLALCGIGMMSAAALTEATIGRWQPTAVLNYGCTGAHRADLLPGDLVIAARVIAYDNVNVNPDGTEHYMQMRYFRQGKQERADYFLADPALLTAAQAAAARLEGRHTPWPPMSGWPDQVPHREPQVRVGTIASADRWNRTHERISGLVAAHDSACEDMEAAAIALICASHDTPFLSIKDISNNELLKVTDSVSFEALGPELGRRAAMLMLETLREISEVRQVQA